ncbi:MAG: GNAT family N-acetyltransferase [Lewinella sp.]
MQRIYPPVYAYLWPDGGQWYLESQYGKENFAREIAQPAADYRFILYDEAPIGILRSIRNVPCPDRPDLRATKLHRLYLDPAVQGRGIGKAAVQQLVGECRERNDECIWLEAMDSAEGSQAFYERTSFTRGGHFILDMPKMLPKWRGMWRYYRVLP